MTHHEQELENIYQAHRYEYTHELPLPPRAVRALAILMNDSEERFTEAYKSALYTAALQIITRQPVTLIHSTKKHTALFMFSLVSAGVVLALALICAFYAETTRQVVVALLIVGIALAAWSARFRQNAKRTAALRALITDNALGAYLRTKKCAEKAAEELHATSLSEPQKNDVREYIAWQQKQAERTEIFHLSFTPSEWELIDRVSKLGHVRSSLPANACCLLDEQLIKARFMDYVIKNAPSQRAQ